jgi:hypothetical protein
MSPETRETLFEIAAANVEALYEQYGGAEGLWATKDDLPSDPAGFTQLEVENVFSRQRLEELLDGGPVTEAELRALREQLIVKPDSESSLFQVLIADF